MARVLGALGGRARAALARPLWVSIAAGVSIARARERAAARRAHRARDAEHAGAGARGRHRATAGERRCDARATARSRARSSRAWASRGRRPHEALLDAVTGLSGSGPAYVFVFLEALADAGVRVGLPRDAAQRARVPDGARRREARARDGRHPAALKDQVTSPGGTTIAGLERLEAGGFRAAVHDAVAAATRRSKELGGAVSAPGAFAPLKSAPCRSCVRLADSSPRQEDAMRLTPLDIQSHHFAAPLRGLDPSEVETFLRMRRRGLRER